MSALRPLPASKVGSTANWPQGHWLSTGALSCVHPSHPRRKGGVKSIPPGDVVYLTGLPGEALCARHAPPVDGGKP